MITIVQTHQHDNVDKFSESSPLLWSGLRTWAAKEKEALLKLNKGNMEVA